jgi:cytochrome c2
MPALFSGPDDPRIEPMVHYLLSLKPPSSKEINLGKDVNAERGNELYHTIGCVACHDPSPDFQPPTGRPEPSEFTYASVAFPELQAKYSLESLTRFLLNPAAVRPDGRMPSFGLSPIEATDLAAHLLDFQDSDPRNAPKQKPFAPDPAKVARGAELYTQLRCAACHEEESKLEPIAITTPDAGCLSVQTSGDLPFYALNQAQRDALKHPAGSPSPVLSLNCLACHTDQGRGGPDAARNHYFVGDEALGDTGRLPPPLTGIGRKLQPAWLTGVLQGKNRVRPYLQTRMPHYSAQTKVLTAALRDARPLPPLVAESHTDLEAGRKLLGTEGGVNCITCHTWADRPSLGIQALDLSRLDERLQPEWFRDYLLNPAGYRPGTLMPPLWPGGKSMIPAILDGDAERQIASIWAFIGKGSGLPPGLPDVASGAFELVPKERPIVQRAFLNGAGPFAILVGFPGGVNLAYNGDTGQPARMWRGRFFDAYSTWFVRAAPFEDPLGTDVHDWPSGEPGSVDRFQGYRLEPDGSPVFLLKIGGAEVSEHFSARDGTLRRELTWAGELKEPAWTHPDRATVTEEPGGGKGKRVFVYRWKP